jgi:carboxymethylenebutenolidase
MDAVGQFLRNVLLVGLALVLIALGGIIGTFAADAVFGPKAAAISNISYAAEDGSTLLAYINIQPGPEMRPGIILVPDMWGLDEQVLRLTNLLANEGYVVIAPDLYRGAASGVLHRAVLLEAVTPDERVLRDLQSAFDYLTSVETVDPNAIGMIGLGYGGGVALRYAASNPLVSAVVNAYGDVLTSPDALGELRGPVMGVFAGRGSRVSAAQVAAFEALLDEAGIENDLTVYDQFTGGFFHFPEITVIGSDVHVAWQQVVAFFDEHLR